MEPANNHDPGEPAAEGMNDADRAAKGTGSATIGAWLLVLAPIVWNLWELRATLLPVAYLDDSSMHEQMVRFATRQLRAGHDPLTSWFPFLGLGSPQFLHYQSTPAMLTGALGLVIGSDTAFRWSFYLLWSLWPLAIYGSGRVFRLEPLQAATAALVAPLLASVPGVGYEQKAYIWIGYGVWTQLFASWTLPFAWAFSWRAIEDRRYLAPAVALVALTVACHFETGYLALLPIGLFPFVVRVDLPRRIARASMLLAASVLASAWVVIPLLVYGKWAAINEPLVGSPLENGYGAGRIISWLFEGRVFDDGRFPVVSILAAIGLIIAIAAWRREARLRPFVLLLAVGLVLSFGRTTFGSLVEILPGSADLFFRRFGMATQLAGIYIAGIGGAALAGLAHRLLRTGFQRVRQLRARQLGWLPVAMVVVAGGAYLYPGWHALDSYDALNAADINYQRSSQANDGIQIGAIVSYIRSHGGGRVYAGDPSNWGSEFTLGSVPMYKFLENEDLDEVGYTLRTASLMTDPEFYFDKNYLGDYALFGIRYLVLPPSQKPPVGARVVMSEGQFALFELPGNGYVRVVDTVGTIDADRSNIALRTLAFVRSRLPREARYPTIGFAGAPPAAPSVAAGAVVSGSPGSVLSEQADLDFGTTDATVHLNRRAVVVLSASYDPGWSAYVDGSPVPTEMVAPALVAVEVPAGGHRVSFRYKGFSWYPELLGLAAFDLLVVALYSARRRRPGVTGPPRAARTHAATPT